MSRSIPWWVLSPVVAILTIWCLPANCDEELDDLHEQIAENVELLDLAEEATDHAEAEGLREAALEGLLTVEGRLATQPGVPPKMLRSVKRQLARAYCALGQSGAGLAKAREVEYLTPTSLELEQIERLRETCGDGDTSSKPNTWDSTAVPTFEDEPGHTVDAAPVAQVQPDHSARLKQAMDRAAMYRAAGRMSEARAEWEWVAAEARTVLETTGDDEALYYGGWAQYLLGDLRRARAPLSAYLAGGAQTHSREAWAIIGDIDARLLEQRRAEEQRQLEAQRQRRYEEDRLREQRRQAEEIRSQSNVYATTPRVSRPSAQAQAALATGLTVGLAGAATVGITYYLYSATPEFTQQGWTGPQAANVVGWVCLGTGATVTVVGLALLAEPGRGHARLGPSSRLGTTVQIRFAPYPGGLVLEGSF